MSTRQEGRASRRRLLCGVWLAGVLAVANAGAAESRSWQLHEFTRVELVAREAGSEPNQHPATLAPDAVRDQLARVRFESPKGPQPLFAADELAELAGPLSQALARAGAGDDVLLLSSSRREAGLLGSPTAVTARLFVQGGELQLLVNDTRFEFYDAWRGAQKTPRFTYPTRRAAGKAMLASAGATAKRADWLSLAAAVPPPAPAAAPVAPPPSAAAAPAPAPPAVAPARPAPPEAARGEDIERRLETLKRLRDRNLITEDEYQQKRKELLQLL